MSDQSATTKCSVCGRRLTNPASIQMGIGPICAAKKGMASFSDPKFRGMFNFSCICPYCDGYIQRVELNQWGTCWQWTCGGIDGDGCHTDFGSNTIAPLKYDLTFQRKHTPWIFQQHRNERAFHKEVATRTFESLGVKAVPPYPGRKTIITLTGPSEDDHQRDQAIMAIVNIVWKEFHTRGYYGRYCQFYDPEMEHCSKCGNPVKRSTMINGLCRRCSNE